MDKKVILVGISRNLNDRGKIFDDICAELCRHGIAYSSNNFGFKIETSNCIIEIIDNDGRNRFPYFDKFVNPPQDILTCVKRNGRRLYYSDLIAYIIEAERGARLNKHKVNYSSYYGKKKELEIEKVKYNGPATIVWWADGTKTVVKCSEEETFDPEKGLAMAICKKALGNKGNYYNAFKKWVPEEEVKEDEWEDWNVQLGSIFAPAFENIAKGIINGIYGIPKDKKKEKEETNPSVSKIMARMCNQCKYYNVEHTEEPCVSCRLHNHWKRRTSEISCADCIHSEKEFYEVPCYHCEDFECFEPKEEKKEVKKNG